MLDRALNTRLPYETRQKLSQLEGERKTNYQVINFFNEFKKPEDASAK